MSVCFTVELLNGTFRGRAGDQTATAWPPSPVRLVGALLSGAHSLDGADGSAPSGMCASARHALSEIVSAPPPIIITPEEPMELATATHWYGARVGEPPELKTLVEMPAVGASFNLIKKPRTVSLFPVGSVIRFHVDVDISDEDQWNALSAAAHAVPFFGASTDHVQITVERVGVEPEHYLGEHVWGPLAAGVKRTGRLLRTWTPETLEWFDDVHSAGGESVADWRITTTRYAHVAPTALMPGGSGIGEFHMLALPAPITLREYAQRVAAVQGWADTDILPAVEFNAPNKVRGFGLYGPGFTTALAAAPDELLQIADFPGTFTSWEPATWIGPSKRWQSATAAAAHRDPRVARIQLDTDLRSHGLRLTALSRRPLMRWHSRQLSVPSNYGLWFITAEAVDLDSDPVTGPLRIGEFLPSGAGLLTPIRS